jgi:hypothetical protein
MLTSPALDSQERVKAKNKGETCFCKKINLVKMQTNDDANNKKSVFKKIISFLWNLLIRLLSQFNVFSLIAGLMVGYLLSRPREYSYIRRIEQLQMQNRSKQDDLQLVVQRLRQEIEVSKAAAQHNARLVEA